MKYLRFLAVFLLVFTTSCSVHNGQVSHSEPCDDHSRESVLCTSEAYSVPTTSEERIKTEAAEFYDSSTRESEAQNPSDSELVICGLDGEPLGDNSDHLLNDGTFFLDDRSYVIQRFSNSYVSFIDTEQFNDEMDFIGDVIQPTTEYKQISVNDKINSLTVSEAEYCQHTTAYGKDYPQYSRLTLDGEITLTGLLVRLGDEKDYGAAIYGGKETILFLPYADSLNNECFPSLHSETIYADFYVDGKKTVAFYGDTLPFVFENNEKLNNLLGQDKYAQSSITLSGISQEWSYYNGSGWSPCVDTVVVKCLRQNLNTPYIEYTSDDELFCHSYPGVYKAYENIISDKNVDNNIELAISQLMDKNMICIYTYFTTSLFQIQEPDESSEDGYLLVEFRFFNNLSEFYKLVESTYTEPISNKLIEGYINLGEPTFVEKNGSVMYNPNYTGLTTGPYFSELGYKIEIIEQSDSLCKFLYTPLFETISAERRNELEKYWGDDMIPHECEAVFENGEWKLNDIIFAF